MIIIPAIDIRNGNCVRLLQGDPEKETIYSGEPLKQARLFQEAGASLIHVVDLDGAFTGKTVNKDIIKDISASLEIDIEVGGGIRTAESIEEYLKAGIERIIMGTVVLTDGFDPIVREYGKYIVAGIDARDSMVATHGWKEVSSMNALDVIQGVLDKGISRVIYTDISTDGMLTGPNISAYEMILSRMPGIDLVASGGVSTMDDIKALAKLADKGLAGCIVGKAIYDGRIDLGGAIRSLANPHS